MIGSKSFKDYLNRMEQSKKEIFFPRDIFNMMMYVNKYTDTSNFEVLMSDLWTMNLLRQENGIWFSDREVQYTALWAVLCTGSLYECETVNHNKFYVFVKPDPKAVVTTIYFNYLEDMEFTINRLDGTKDIYTLAPVVNVIPDSEENKRINNLITHLNESYIIISNKDF